METVDLENAKWVSFYADGWKPHVVHKSLLNGLMSDASSRHHSPGNVEVIYKGFIDLPGMIMKDRSYQKIEVVDGFTLEIPSQDFLYYFRELRDGPEREFSTGQKYYKIHGWLVCMVFSTEQRDRILSVMRERLEEVNEIAKREDEEFSNRLKKINKDGIKIVSPRDPESMKVLEKVLVSPKNEEKN